MKVNFTLLLFFFGSSLSAQYTCDFDDWPIIAEGEWTQDFPEGQYLSFGCYCNFGNTLSGLRKIGFNGPGDALQLPPVSYPESVRFQARTSTGSSAELAVEYFSAGSWISAGACAIISESYSPCEVFMDVPEVDVPLRIVMTAFGSSVFLDDLDITGTFLPVEMDAFSARAGKRGQVILEWRTASEQNNDRFLVQRSPDGKAFTTIAEVPGAGTTVLPRRYSFIDQNPPGGITYYRLQQLDFDDSFSYSEIISLVTARATRTFTIYPTLVQEDLTLNLPSDQEVWELEIFNLQGRTVHRRRLPAGTRQWQLNLSNLTGGQYCLLLKGKTGMHLKTFIKA